MDTRNETVVTGLRHTCNFFIAQRFMVNEASVLEPKPREFEAAFVAHPLGPDVSILNSWNASPEPRERVGGKRLPWQAQLRVMLPDSCGAPSAALRERLWQRLVANNHRSKVHAAHLLVEHHAGHAGSRLIIWLLIPTRLLFSPPPPSPFFRPSPSLRTCLTTFCSSAGKRASSPSRWPHRAQARQPVVVAHRARRPQRAPWELPWVAAAPEPLARHLRSRRGGKRTSRVVRTRAEGAAQE